MSGLISRAARGAGADAPPAHRRQGVEVEPGQRRRCPPPEPLGGLDAQRPGRQELVRITAAVPQGGQQPGPHDVPLLPAQSLRQRRRRRRFPQGADPGGRRGPYLRPAVRQALLGQIAHPRVTAQHGLGQGAVHLRGAHGDIRDRGQQLDRNTGEPAQDLQGTGRRARVCERLAEQLGMLRVPRPGGLGLNAVEDVAVETRDEGVGVASQARHELLDGSRVGAPARVAAQRHPVPPVAGAPHRLHCVEPQRMREGQARGVLGDPADVEPAQERGALAGLAVGRGHQGVQIETTTACGHGGQDRVGGQRCVDVRVQGPVDRPGVLGQ